MNENFELNNAKLTARERAELLALERNLKWDELDPRAKATLLEEVCQAGGLAQRYYHQDDYYLPHEKRNRYWERLPLTKNNERILKNRPNHFETRTKKRSC